MFPALRRRCSPCSAALPARSSTPASQACEAGDGLPERPRVARHPRRKVDRRPAPPAPSAACGATSNAASRSSADSDVVCPPPEIGGNCTSGGCKRPSAKEDPSAPIWSAFPFARPVLYDFDSPQLNAGLPPPRTAEAHSALRGLFVLGAESLQTFVSVLFSVFASRFSQKWPDCCPLRSSKSVFPPRRLPAGSIRPVPDAKIAGLWY